MLTLQRLSIPLLAVLALFTTGPVFAGDVSPEQVLDTLRPGHPRVMLTDARLGELKQLAATDAVLRGFLDTLRRDADKLLDAPPLEHKLVGPRLLSVSRACVDRVYTLALAWRFFGEERYAKAAEANLLTVCAFKDWNPSHFLDVAEMSHAVGVGYDWLYPWLSESSRAAIRGSLLRLGLDEGIKVYKRGGGWPESDFNWNQVCNGGMLVGALALAETDPDYARYIVPMAVASLPKAIASYDPDGAWMEGPGYWGYATRYTAYGLCALDTALGTDFGLSNTPGLRLAGDFPIETTGPTGLYLNYADSGSRSKRGPQPCLFWLAAKYGNASYSDAEHALLRVRDAEPQHIVWYVPPTGQPAAARPLDKHFRGKVDVAVMRSAWDDPDALFVGVKGGYNQVNHGHLDLGNFELDALGVRWARDLGSDDYNLPGYWDKKPGGKRWQYYRLNSQSHNVVTIDGADQDASAVTRVLGFKSKRNTAAFSLDLTEAYPAAKKVVREVALVDHRRSLRVRDEVQLKDTHELAWGMTTDAAVAIEGDMSAVLTQDGKQLRVRAKAPRGAHFVAESAERAAPENANKGVQRLVLRVPQAHGRVKFEVVFAPDWAGGAAQK